MIYTYTYIFTIKTYKFSKKNIYFLKSKIPWKNSKSFGSYSILFSLLYVWTFKNIKQWKSIRSVVRSGSQTDPFWLKGQGFEMSAWYNQIWQHPMSKLTMLFYIKMCIFSTDFITRIPCCQMPSSVIWKGKEDPRGWGSGSSSLHSLLHITVKCWLMEPVKIPAELKTTWLCWCRWQLGVATPP